MWFILMLVMLLTNGMSSFGLKVIVALAGRIFFRERMDRLNVIGVSLGFLAVILLGLSSA
jgi:EamA domain-containing membrane protein RarD